MAKASFCEVVYGNDCMNPPGYGIGGLGVADNSDGPRTRTWCRVCGAFACAKCRVGKPGDWLCLDCEVKRQEEDARANEEYEAQIDRQAQGAALAAKLYDSGYVLVQMKPEHMLALEQIGAEFEKVGSITWRFHRRVFVDD